MKSFVASLLALIAVCGCMGQTSSEIRVAHAELQRTQRAASTVIPEFRNAIAPILSSTQADILQNTTIRVPDSWEAQARAFRDPETGKRYIELNAGLAQIYDWMATSIAAIAPVNSRCAQAYVGSIFEALMDNSKSVAVDAGETRAYPPFGFAQRNPQVCSGISESLLTGSDLAQKKRLALLGASMQWTLAHELGHQIYGHVDIVYREPMSSRDLARSRENEMQADMLAFRALQQKGFDPILAMPAYQFIGIMDSDAEHEGTSDHPSGPRRFGVLVRALEADTNDPKFRSYLINSGQMDQWQRTLSQLRSFTGQ